MGKAEVGTPKYIANQIKARGLQRLRWYCQVCEKQCRDENGFKCHTQSESHLRQMLLVGDKAKERIEEYSQQFVHDFITLLKTSHQEKKININRFYQEYIANKEHIHMNATKWTTLTQFSKFLKENNICRVEETEQDGLCISWIDNSPRALEMKKALKRKNQIEANDDEFNSKLLESQIEAARKQQEEKKNQLEAASLVAQSAMIPVKNNGGPISISIKKNENENASIKPPTSTNSTTATRKANVFASLNKISKSKPSKTQQKKSPSTLEKLMLEDKKRLQKNK